MSQSLSLQANVDNIGFGAFSAVKALLQVTSADNVDPLAISQLAALGSMFNVSGPLAAAIPDTLRRCTSHRIEKIGLIVGWRKGDAACYLAQTAGGQAGALLCLCVENLVSNDAAGLILHSLCESLLSKNDSIAGVEQLADVSKLLADKTSQLNFTKIFTTETTRIQMEYSYLEKRAPRVITQPLSKESIIELLKAISEVLRHDAAQLRISGSIGQGYIAAIVMTLCPDDALITIESRTVFQGIRTTIWIDIRDDRKLCIKSGLLLSEGLGLEIPLDRYQCYYDDPQLRSPWRGFLSNKLDVQFNLVGSPCNNEIKQMFGRILIGMPLLLDEGSPSGQFVNRGGIRGFVGTNAEIRILKVTETILDLRVGEVLGGARQASDVLETLSTFLEKIMAHLNCEKAPCGRYLLEVLDLRKFYPDEDHEQPLHPKCSHTRFWIEIARAFVDGIAAFFIVAEPDSTIKTSVYSKVGTKVGTLPLRLDSILSMIYRLVAPDAFTEYSYCWPDKPLKECLYHSGGKLSYLGFSSDGTTIHPSILSTLEVPTDMGLGFRLYSGKFYLNGRYHDLLRQSSFAHIRTNHPHPELANERVYPSGDDVHDRLFITIGEVYRALEISTVVQVDSCRYDHNLENCVEIFYKMFVSTPCSCVRGSPPSSESLPRLFRSPIVPSPNLDFESDEMYLTMVQGSREAQFLACGISARGLYFCDEKKMLQGPKTCLRCAILEARNLHLKWVIVV